VETATELRDLGAPPFEKGDHDNFHEPKRMLYRLITIWISHEVV
jgi:hypothetical protein